jgi:TonB family protein
MKNPFYLCCILLLGAITTTGLAQRPRTINSTPADQKATENSLPPPPATVRAKYEGGIFGYNKKEDGTLTFDDANGRLVFRNKLNKEMIAMPFTSITAAYGDTKSLRPAAATVIGAIPSIFALPAQFIRRKYQYLTLQFRDPDNNVSGITSFKLENKEVLASELVALAEKSGLTQRGDGYVRKAKPPEDSQTASASASDAADSTISAGVLNAKATVLPRPDYPESARKALVAGTVTVQVTVDEQGSVVDAKAVNGDAMLYEAAEAAARKAKFAPAVYKVRPVRMIGVLNYNFVL